MSFTQNIRLEHQSDFYHYMIDVGKLRPKTAHDYISRLRFLAEFYDITKDFDEDKIQSILDSETSKLESRDVYNTKFAIKDFRACLKKYLAFLTYNYVRHIEKTTKYEEENIKQTARTSTERTALMKSRIGQGIFRERLIEFWHGCSITQCRLNDVLIASHIKPWRVANNEERLDPFNGLLLLPNYDKLFDFGYISFNNNGKIILSSLLSPNDCESLSVNRNLALIRIDDRHLPYLEYHRSQCLIP